MDSKLRGFEAQEKVEQDKWFWMGVGSWWAIKGGFTEKPIFGKEANCVEIWRKVSQRRGTARAKVGGASDGFKEQQRML